MEVMTEITSSQLMSNNEDHQFSQEKGSNSNDKKMRGQKRIIILGFFCVFIVMILQIINSLLKMDCSVLADVLELFTNTTKKSEHSTNW